MGDVGVHGWANHAAWLQALDEDAGQNAHIIHLQECCTFRVENETKKFQCELTGDVKLMMVTNGGGGGVLVGLPGCHRVGAHGGHGKRNSMGGISSKCLYSDWRLRTHRLLGNQCS